MPALTVSLPELRIRPDPLTPEALTRLLGNGRRLALLFAAEPELLQGTIHQLQLDADAAARQRGLDRVAVLGVHADWRTRDCRHARCALLVDTDGLVSQCTFEHPISMDVAWILHLPLEGEQQLHESLSRECREAGVPLINPYGASERADDKMRAHQLWAGLLARGGRDFALPAATTIPRGASASEAAASIRDFAREVGSPARLVVQPNRGTEGGLAAGATLDAQDIESLGPGHPLVCNICQGILVTDDALIRQERGNVRVRADISSPLLNSSTDLRRVAFRLNVAWDGADFVAESGFAQVAPSTDAVVASRGREGAIADINKCLAALYLESEAGWRRWIPSDDDLSAMKRAAEAAARALNADLEEHDYLKHMGIDMVLEVDAGSGKMIPVLLEANARPAGLNQSTALRGVAPGPSRLHITTALFAPWGQSFRV